jgi:phosphatidylethanolamine/phosphatidyl-N-methylethanolamine N-methyltransferase
VKLTNRWNKIIYRAWAPIYDSTVNHIFQPGRRRALELLNLVPGEKVLLVGIGTGADLSFLPAGVVAMGIDLSREMLVKARKKLDWRPADVVLIQGDAQTLLVGEASFDAVILNLILSVIPDGNACLQSALHALKPNGRAVIFDKFLAEGKSASTTRKMVNFFSTILGTDINRHLSDITRGCPCEVTHNEPSIAGGIYRVFLLKKIG